jgi:polyhydroxybutyrate depolymerase
LKRALAALLLLAGCKRPPPSQHVETQGGRGYDVRVAESHDRKAPAPVLFLLHPYATQPQDAEAYFQFKDALGQRGWILVVPGGTLDRDQAPFWNATDACCDRFGSGVDDLGYLDGVIADVERRFAVDPRRVFAMGTSNGGFFAHRLACDRSEKFTAVVSINGAGFADMARCQAKQNVALLQVHGDQDELVLYDGGTQLLGAETLEPYAGARGPVAWWAKHNGCTALGPAASGLDFDRTLPGDETRVEAWGGCGAPVELWTVVGGKHFLPPSATATATLLQWLQRASSNPR